MLFCKVNTLFSRTPVLIKFNRVFSLMAKLEKADQAFCFTSGMAALAAVTHLIQAGKLSSIFLGIYDIVLCIYLYLQVKLMISGQEIVAGEDIYGGSDRLLSQVVPRHGIIVKLV